MNCIQRWVRVWRGDKFTTFCVIFFLVHRKKNERRRSHQSSLHQVFALPTLSHIQDQKQQPAPAYRDRAAKLLFFGHADTNLLSCEARCLIYTSRKMHDREGRRQKQKNNYGFNISNMKFFTNSYRHALPRSTV